VKEVRQMKKFSVRKLETVKTTAAMYGACPRVSHV
jgi:hypothetical protein